MKGKVKARDAFTLSVSLCCMYDEAPSDYVGTLKEKERHGLYFNTIRILIYVCT